MTTLAFRVNVALVVANLRYWLSVAPVVRRELRRWRRRAEAIVEPTVRGLAVRKLDAERFNAEVAATLATLAPHAHRKSAIEAIVALEVLYDFLDGLTELPREDPLRRGARLYDAFTDALTSLPSSSSNYYEHEGGVDDGGYMLELSSTVRRAVGRLPGRAAIAQSATRAAERCAACQVRVHAAPRVGAGQLERWARESTDAETPWREYVAGAVASVLAVHALIAAAADERFTVEQAEATDAAYLSISAISTMLDSLVDYGRDLTEGDPWLVGLYGEPRLVAARLVAAMRRAVVQAEALPQRAHHLMTIVGVLAYYTSAPEVRRGAAGREVARLQRELRPVLAPTFAVMWTWRLLKRLRSSPRDTSSSET